VIITMLDLTPPCRQTPHRNSLLKRKRRHRISAAHKHILHGWTEEDVKPSSLSSKLGLLPVALLSCFSCFGAGVVYGRLGTSKPASSLQHARGLKIKSPLPIEEGTADLYLRYRRMENSDSVTASKEIQSPARSELSYRNADPDSIMANVPFPFQIIILIILIGFSGLFAGLTLGLMTLDKTGLEIIMSSDDPVSAEYAKQIYPIRTADEGSLLLCTLLLGNVATNALLSIALSDLTSGFVGFVLSTAVIVVFGEVVPQAICSRHPLEIGSMAIPIVRVIMCLMWWLAKPLAMCLNKLLGKETRTMYSKAEMHKLLELHFQHGKFDHDTALAMMGSLKYQDITVREVMTPLEETFMLDVNGRLNFETMEQIFRGGGYNNNLRIPVYRNERENVIGLLFVKDLIFVNPNDEMPICHFLGMFGDDIQKVRSDDRLGDVLTAFKKGFQIAGVVQSPQESGNTDQEKYEQVTGIITMVDIIEVILGADIMDEVDLLGYENFDSSTRGDRKIDLEGCISTLGRSGQICSLSSDEIWSVSSYLKKMEGTNGVFKDFSEWQLLNMILISNVVEVESETRVETEEQEFPSGSQNSSANNIYRKDVQTDLCTLILDGKVTTINDDSDGNGSSEQDAPTILCVGALVSNKFRPANSAFVSSKKAKFLQISRANYKSSLKMSRMVFDSFQSNLTSRSSSSVTTVQNGTKFKNTLVNIDKSFSPKSNYVLLREFR